MTRKKSSLFARFRCLQTSLRALNKLVKHLRIFEHYHASPLLEAIEKNPEDLEELVDQFLWINTSLGNW